MGFNNSDYDIMIDNNINRNTIVVNVLESIFANI